VKTTNFSAMTDEERKAAFSGLDSDALAAAITEAKDEAKTLFALTEVTTEQADEAEALMASIGHMEAEDAERTAEADKAAQRFAAARDAFAASTEPSADDSDDSADDSDDSDDTADADDTDADDSADDTDADDAADSADSADADADSADVAAGDAVTTAAARPSQKAKVPASKKVAAATKRPDRKRTQPVTITAAADVPGFATSAPLSGMEEVTKALMGRVKGFQPFNLNAAKAARQASGGKAVLNKVGVASFGLDRPAALVASGTPGQEYEAMKNAIEDHKKAVIATLDAGKTLTAGALVAAGWCAPSPVAYNYIADYVVDGLLTVPEVGAPRGGLMTTTGPERSSQDEALDDFGWTQTEAEAEARTVKECEVIVCPDFEDNRLDAIGYCYKIPLLTQKAYPELITDALKFAGVLYAHRSNRRMISDIVGMSDAVTFSGYGPSMTDSLEALSLIAVAERRRWNLGQSAVMEVKVPAFALEIYRADISRRNGIAKDSVSDGDIARHFADRRLAVEYVADWQEISVRSGALVLPGAFDVLIYPAGTFVTAREDVISLQGVYDAASLSVNEYTGVFFEQGYMTIKAGYGASQVTIPINTAGEQGALTLNGLGDTLAGGSF
jgi:hypothetical protein